MFDRYSKMHTRPAFVHTLHEIVEMMIARPAAMRILEAEGEMPETRMQDVEALALSMFRMEFSLAPVHERLVPSALDKGSHTYALALAEALGYMWQREGEREILPPATSSQSTYEMGHDHPSGIIGVLEAAGVRLGRTTFAAIALGSPQEANARVRAAAAEVKRVPFTHRGLAAPLPHRVDDGVAYLIEALWLHAESCRRKQRFPLETARADRIATILHVLAWERCRYAVLVARLKTVLRVAIKAPQADRGIFGPVVDILGSVIEQQLDGRMIQGLLRSAGRRNTRGELERGALDALVRARTAEAMGGVAERMDAQGLYPDDVIADPEFHLLARLYMTGKLRFP